MTFSAVFGVLAALAFVLALLGLTVWAMKRMGVARAGARARLPMEIVQRVALGPKLSIAVVRVGEKVMAVSVGDGAVTPLFELADDDRTRVLDSSRVPTPHESSPLARSSAFPVPTLASPAFDRVLAATQQSDAAMMRELYSPPSSVAPATETPRRRAMRSAVAADAATHVDQLLTPADPAPPVTMSARIAPQSRGLAEFQSVLRMALSGATRLGVVVALASMLAHVTPLSAQAAPASSPAPATTQPSVSPAPTPSRPAARPAPTPRGSEQPRVPSGPPARDTKSRAAQPPSGEAVMPGVPPRVETISPQSTPSMSVSLGDAKQGDGLQVNGTVGVVLLMGMMTLLPTLVLMMTGFTRIMIVLNFLKQAMGTQNAPPGQLVAALALILTGFVMAPTIEVANRTAITPWLDGRMEQMQMLSTASQPFREFMLAQTRESDLRTFIELSGAKAPATPADIPLVTLMSAFTASELRTAFQIGFAIYLPFIVIDAVVASVLMSMGMMMLPPAMISMPFKLLLFVLVDGWTLVVESLVRSFK
jgi:flagellar biosynthesis protein FliP